MVGRLGSMGEKDRADSCDLGSLLNKQIADHLNRPDDSCHQRKRTTILRATASAPRALRSMSETPRPYRPSPWPWGQPSVLAEEEPSARQATNSWLDTDLDEQDDAADSDYEGSGSDTTTSDSEATSDDVCIQISTTLSSWISPQPPQQDGHIRLQTPRRSWRNERTCLVKSLC